MFPRACVVSCCLVAALPSAGGPQQPSFRTSTDIIAVDVGVVDGDGRPVEGLAASDFLLTIDGVERPVLSADFVAIARASQTREVIGDAAHAFYSSNDDAVSGRLIVLAVDRGGLRAGGSRTALSAAAAFLDRLETADLVALWTLPAGGPTVDFTADRERIREALNRIGGQAHPVNTRFAVGLTEALAYVERDNRWNYAVQRECNERFRDTFLRFQCRSSMEQDAQEIVDTAKQSAIVSMAHLQSLLQRLSAIDAPKTLVLLSEGLVTGTPRNPTAFLDTRPIGAAAAAARASVYVLHLQARQLEMARTVLAPTYSEDEAILRLGLDSLATRTGGAVLPAMTRGDAAFARISLETSAYYLLAVESRLADRDGRPHRLQVEVRRENVTVRARADIVVPPPSGRVRTHEDDLIEMLRTPGHKGTLPISLSTYEYLDPVGRTQVIIASSIDKGVQTPEELSVGYVIADARGEVVASRVDHRTLEVTGRGDLGRYRYTTTSAVGPGTYVLRLAALDGRGRRGMVEHAFEVTDQQIPDELLLFEEARANEGPGNPLSDGIVHGDRLHLHLVMRADAAAAPTALLEIARDRHADPLATMRAAVAPETGGGRIFIDGTFPLDRLPPGEQIARAVVSVPGREPVTLYRPFRIVGSE